MYASGTTSFNRDCERSDNPHRVNSKNWHRWNAEFNDALGAFTTALAAHTGPLPLPLLRFEGMN